MQYSSALSAPPNRTVLAHIGALFDTPTGHWHSRISLLYQFYRIEVDVHDPRRHEAGSEQMLLALSTWQNAASRS